MQNKNNTLIVVLIAIIAILLLCVCIALPAGYYFLNKPKTPPIDDIDITFDNDNKDLNIPTPFVEDYCDFPNGDVEDWWYIIDPKMQDCYIDMYGTPLFLDELNTDDTSEITQTPIEYVSDYIIRDLENQYTDFTLDDEIATEEKIEITFTYENQTQTLWIIKSTETDNSAEVIVGYPNAGGILYRLEKNNGSWELAEIIDEGL